MDDDFKFGIFGGIIIGVVGLYLWIGLSNDIIIDKGALDEVCDLLEQETEFYPIDVHNENLVCVRKSTEDLILDHGRVIIKEARK